MLPANFNQLYYFWTIAKAGSISAAAKRLLLNQSTLSIQLKQLERSLTKTLLIRDRSGVTLTPEGRLAFDACERMFASAEQLVAVLKGGRPAQAPVFRLGASRSVSSERVLSAAAFIQAVDRKASTRIVTAGAEELARRLESRQLDLALTDADLASRLGRGHLSRLITRIPLSFVASPALKRAMGSFPSGLDRVPLLVRSPDNPVRIEVDHFLQRHGLSPVIHSEVEDPDLIRLMALRGEGAGLLDPRSARSALQSGRLVALHRRPIGIFETLWFAVQRVEREPEVQRLIDALLDRFDFLEAAPGTLDKGGRSPDNKEG